MTARGAPGSFVGRERELAAVEGAFERGARVVTLWGPGGIGKTRLGQEVLARRGEDPVFVDLSEVGAAELVVRIGEAVGAPQSPAAVEVDRIGAVGRRLRERGAALLFLDPLEHVEAVAKDAIAAWLEVAPELEILAGSRQPLRLPGEAVVEVGPLDVEAAALALFVERVRARRADFELGEAQRGLAIELCARLEGIPLAIELAAARVETLGLKRLVERLKEPLAVLDRGARGQKTLRSTIDWSWGLLEPDERRVLAAASALGDFTAAEAEAVIGPGAGERVAGLRERSLLRSDGARYTMLDAVREFAAEKLDELGERAPVEDRHRAYFVRFAEERLQRLKTGERSHAIAELTAAERDLTALLDRALAAEDPAALTAIAALEPVVFQKGPLAPFLQRIERALAGPTSPTGLYARALAARAKGLAMIGRTEEAVAELVRAESIADDRLALAEIRLDRGVVLHQARRLEEAGDAYRAALATPGAEAMARVVGRAKGNLGALAHDEQRFDEAEALYTEALGRFAAAGDRRLEGIFETNLGVLKHERERRIEARGHFLRGLELLEGEGDRRHAGITRGNLGTLHLEEGDLADAKAEYKRALPQIRAAGDRRSEVLCLGRLGAVVALLEEEAESGVDPTASADEIRFAAPSRARIHLDAAEGLARELGDGAMVQVIELYRGFIDLAVVLAARRSGSEDAAAADALKERIRRARARDGSRPSLAERLDDARLTLRVFERALGGQLVFGEAREGAGLGAEALVIGPEAMWFRPPGGDWQDFRRRQAPRLLLLGLIQQQREAPGRGLSGEALQAIGWPGERMSPDSALNRVRVTLATLRKMGLKDVILSRADGYLLDPALAVLETAVDFDQLSRE